VANATKLLRIGAVASAACLMITRPLSLVLPSGKNEYVFFFLRIYWSTFVQSNVRNLNCMLPEQIYNLAVPNTQIHPELPAAAVFGLESGRDCQVFFRPGKPSHQENFVAGFQFGFHLSQKIPDGLRIQQLRSR